MQTALPRLGHVLLALDQHLHLLADLPQAGQHLSVAVDEPEDLVLNPRLRAELLDERLQLAEVVPRHSREEVVHGLELQTAVDEVEPGGAVDVHGGAELALGERLGVAQVRGGGGPVGEGDLDVEREGEDVADEDEGDA